MQLGVDFVDLTAVSIPVELAKYVPRNLAKRFLVVPVKLVQDRLYLAMHDPLDFVAQDEVKTASRKRIIPHDRHPQGGGAGHRAPVWQRGHRPRHRGDEARGRCRRGHHPAQMARDTADPEASAPHHPLCQLLIERALH